jgi:hypothetical protein
MVECHNDHDDTPEEVYGLYAGVVVFDGHNKEISWDWQTYKILLNHIELELKRSNSHRIQILLCA